MSAQTKTILVVDDDEGMRDTISAILKRDYDVRVAESGEEGLGILKKSNINLMLLDVRLPGMSGLEVLRVVRDHYSEVEVIVVSALNDVDVAVQAMKDGGLPLHHQGIRLRRPALPRAKRAAASGPQPASRLAKRPSCRPKRSRGRVRSKSGHA